MPVFIFGAGFNGDAVREPGPIFGTSIYVGEYRIDCGYPLVADAARLCFGLDGIPSDKSIEELFADALERHDLSPVNKLAQRIMEADYRLAARLACSKDSNCYRQFFETFAASHFLTFNYDSLPETFLFRMGRWYPHDGYGMPVKTEVLPGADEFLGRKSTSLVLHLHGSFCLYTSEFEKQRKSGDRIAWLTPREQPLYLFDPDSISSNFAPFRRVSPTNGYEPIDSRVIAPIPDKAQGLKEAFMRETYHQALGLVRSSGTLVAIGYSFNDHDRTSYQPVLEALVDSRDRKLLVVSPDADKLRRKLEVQYSPLNVEAIDETFKGWVATSFRGVCSEPR